MNRPDEPDADEDSSDDDDEGPEDLDGYKGKGVAAGVGSSAAADKFPEVGTSAAAEEHTVPGGLEDVTAPAATTATPAPVDPTAIGAVGAGRTASTTSIAPISRQDTGGSDFHDAITSEPPSEPSLTKEPMENTLVRLQRAVLPWQPSLQAQALSPLANVVTAILKPSRVYRRLLTTMCP